MAGLVGDAGIWLGKRNLGFPRYLTLVADSDQ